MDYFNSIWNILAATWPTWLVATVTCFIGSLVGKLGVWRNASTEDKIKILTEALFETVVIMAAIILVAWIIITISQVSWELLRN